MSDWNFERLEDEAIDGVALQPDDAIRVFDRLDEANKEIERLRELAGAAYQFAGIHDAPVEWLDALSAAAAGDPFSCEGLLPLCAKERKAMIRKPIQIAAMGINILFALCDDGTIWQQISGVFGWKLIAGVPQEELP